MGVNAAAGLIDGQGTGRAHTMALAAAIVPRLTVPVTVDFEGGFSDDPAVVAELAAELAGLGVAGINLEDASAGGTLRDPAAQARIIGAVRAAAPDLFVNARTDVFWLKYGPAGRLGGDPGPAGGLRRRRCARGLRARPDRARRHRGSDQPDSAAAELALAAGARRAAARRRGGRQDQHGLGPVPAGARGRPGHGDRRARRPRCHPGRM